MSFASLVVKNTLPRKHVISSKGRRLSFNTKDAKDTKDSNASSRDTSPLKGTPFFGQVRRGDLMYLQKNGDKNEKERRC